MTSEDFRTKWRLVVSLAGMCGILDPDDLVDRLTRYLWDEEEAGKMTGEAAGGIVGGYADEPSEEYTEEYTSEQAEEEALDLTEEADQSGMSQR